MLTLNKIFFFFFFFYILSIFINAHHHQNSLSTIHTIPNPPLPKPHLLQFISSTCSQCANLPTPKLVQPNTVTIGLVNLDDDTGKKLGERFQVKHVPCWIWVDINGRGEKIVNAHGHRDDSGGVDGVKSVVDWVNDKVGRNVLAVEEGYTSVDDVEGKPIVLDEKVVEKEMIGKGGLGKIWVVWLYFGEGQKEWKRMKDVFKEVSGMFGESGGKVKVGMADGMNVGGGKRVLEMLGLDEKELLKEKKMKVLLLPPCDNNNRRQGDGKCKQEVNVCDAQKCKGAEDVVMFINRYLMQKLGLLGPSIDVKNVQEGEELSSVEYQKLRKEGKLTKPGSIRKDSKETSDEKNKVKEDETDPTIVNQKSSGAPPKNNGPPHGEDEALETLKKMGVNVGDASSGFNISPEQYEALQAQGKIINIMPGDTLGSADDKEARQFIDNLSDDDTVQQEDDGNVKDEL